MVWVLLGLLSGLELKAQQLNNQRTVVFPVTSDTVQLDTLSVVPVSFSVYTLVGDSIPPSNYGLDWAGAQFWWIQPPAVDSVRLQFRVFPLLLTKPYRHKSDTIINQTPEIVINPFEVKPDDPTYNLIDFGGLDYNGSFARGISFGNNQDVVLNSSFNLQLAGTLGDDVEILAAMTDNNLPIQPEGNTQQIQEFDRVFIQLRKQPHQLTVGDFPLIGRPGYFMVYNKKLQGGQYQLRQKQENGNLDATASLAISKGQFARNTFQGQEGNQGPYRLTGNNGESFIIVLSGTERVYIDGQLMQRGTLQDYVIDYNTGEVTFTPNRLITKDSRIVIEFEYSVQNYFRTLVHGNLGWESDRWEFAFNIYNEQDSKNQPILEEPDSARRAVLVAAGDSLDQAVFPGFDSVGYVNDQVRYAQIDTNVMGTLYSPVFVYSTNPDSAYYQVRFSYVGPGNGDYRIAETIVNGRVYEWVAPVNGVPQGAYEPVVRLVAPEQRQLITASAKYKTGKQSALDVEVGLSNRDFNTFSEIDGQDDRGVAAKVGWQQRITLQSDSLKSRQLEINARYEFAGANFRPIETYRPIEFTRNWNTTQLTRGTANEHWGTADLDYVTNDGYVGYGFSFYLLPGQYDGFMHSSRINLRPSRWKFLSETSYLTTTTETEQSAFFRPTWDVAHRLDGLGDIQIGIKGFTEDNRVNAVGTDSLTMQSFSFTESEVYLQSPDTGRLALRAALNWRGDWLPVEGDFNQASEVLTAKLQGQWSPSSAQQLIWQLNYRTLPILDTNLLSDQATQVALGRINYSLQLFKGLIRSTILYEIGSGQEQRREYTYVKVQEGQGTHVWNDDGNEIPELDEFEPASVNDQIFANYLRVFTPTNEFVQSNQNQVNLSLDLNPGAVLKGKEGSFADFLSRWSALTGFRANRKVLADGESLNWNPFDLDVSDLNLLNVSSSLRSSLFFNRFGGTLGLELTRLDNRSKQLLTNGPESSTLAVWEGKGRVQLSRKFKTQLESRLGERSNSSAALANRNYRFSILEFSPNLTYQSGTILRISGGYTYGKKKNEQEFGGEFAEIHELELEGRYNVVVKSNLNVRFSLASINYTGQPNTTLAYTMLEGLRDGQNFIWTIGYERRLANNIQLSLTYDGRKSTGADVIHVGRAQVRAIF